MKDPMHDDGEVYDTIVSQLRHAIPLKHWPKYLWLRFMFWRKGIKLEVALTNKMVRQMREDAEERIFNRKDVWKD